MITLELKPFGVLASIDVVICTMTIFTEIMMSFDGLMLDQLLLLILIPQRIAGFFFAISFYLKFGLFEKYT